MFKIREKYKFLSVIFAMILFALFLYFEKTKDESEPSVCFKDSCFNVEIADSPEEWEKGLMNREYLEKGKGMLFVFEKEGIYKFWMKDTLIPLDIIWIDGAGKVVYIKGEARPCKTDLCESFSPDEKTKYVLEINGGSAKLREINVGDRAEIKY